LDNTRKRIESTKLVAEFSLEQVTRKLLETEKQKEKAELKMQELQLLMLEKEKKRTRNCTITSTSVIALFVNYTVLYIGF